MKHAFIIVTLLLGVVLVVMIFTKPDEQKHYEAVTGLVQTVVEQEMSEDNLTERLAKAGAEKLADLGIEGVDEKMLADLGAEGLAELGEAVNLNGIKETGEAVAVGTAQMYLRSHMTVNDYIVANVGWIDINGRTLPITIGVFGKVIMLVDESEVRQLIRF